jgi:NAD(P)-dependent dehydrogenase (short-subunit alcohol dehydrogenase family)
MFQSDLLAGRVLLVTGGGTGLGRAMAIRAAGLGAKVAVLGRTAAHLDAVVEEIRAAGGTAMSAAADVRDPAQVSAAFEAIEAGIGPVDTLVNNAAGNFLAPSEDLSANAFDAVVQIVLYGTFHCTMEFGRRAIAAQRGGNILSIVTTYAWMGSPFVLPSASAKAGVLAMTRTLAVEWATYGIRCNAIAPGPIPTKGAFSRLMAGGMEDQAKVRIPARRFGRPEEIADLAVYLMADGSDYITGECVVLDGGEWLQSGQEFSSLVLADRGSVKQLLASMKPKKGE